MELPSVIVPSKLCIDRLCSFVMYCRNTMGMPYTLKFRGYFLNLCVVEVEPEEETRVKSCNYRE
jgi:hypothetical protein